MPIPDGNISDGGEHLKKMKKRINNGIRRIGLSLAIASVAAISASAQTNGSVVLGAPQTPIGMTIPRGGAWIPGAAAGSGHFWTPDGVNGVCRVDGVGVTSNCDL